MARLARFSLVGRVAIVTGASSGLGADAAVGLAEAGCDLVVIARREQRLRVTAERVEAAGRRCVIVVGDVADPETATRTVAAAMDAFGRVDLLLNNAGMGSSVPATRETPEDFRRIQEVNVNGSFWFAQACSRVMLPGSAIINVSSVLGLTTAGLPQAGYSTSKSAIVGLTRDLAQQWTGRKGIRVNAIAPGLFPSEMTGQYTGDHLQQVLKRVPAGKMGDPSHFVDTVVFLASDAAGYISGVTLPVDGGMLTS